MYVIYVFVYLYVSIVLACHCVCLYVNCILYTLIYVHIFSYLVNKLEIQWIYLSPIEKTERITVVTHTQHRNNLLIYMITLIYKYIYTRKNMTYT